MKNTGILATAICCIAVYGCSNASLEQNSSSRTFSCTLEDNGGGKTVLAEAGSLLWSAGDRIIVNGEISEALEQDRTASATFLVNAPVQAPYTAVYPASAAVSGNGLVLPELQQVKEGGFDPEAALMAVMSENETLRFHHLCGYLRINIEYPANCSRRATEITFASNSEETVAGVLNLAFDAEGIPSATISAEEGSSTIRITAESGLSSFLIALPECRLDRGFSLRIADQEGVFLTAKTDNNVEIVKSRILNAPALKFSAADGKLPDLVEDEGGNEPIIVWESPVLVSGWCSTYGRVHRLNDGRLMCCYGNTWNSYARFSSDDGTVWSEAKTVASWTGDKTSTCARMDNPEFAQLSASNPYKPGRIIYAVNERVNRAIGSTSYESEYPFHISIAVSDDNGQTWSQLRRLYSSSSSKGCYEPFILELPDGRVQIYFADESPYFYGGYQNISVMESTDGGENWGEKRIACYSSSLRDGMPTATFFNGNIYLAIEYMGSQNEKFHPQIICESLKDNWSSIVYNNSAKRFFPFAKSLASSTVYTGAPYLIQTENYFVLSYQSTKGSKGDADTAHAVMEVQLCPKSEMSEGKFTTMRSATRPMKIDQSKSCGKWNSLCSLGDDTIMAITSTGGKGHESSAGFLYVVKGRITTKSLNFE